MRLQAPNYSGKGDINRENKGLPSRIQKERKGGGGHYGYRFIRGGGRAKKLPQKSGVQSAIVYTGGRTAPRGRGGGRESLLSQELISSTAPGQEKRKGSKEKFTKPLIRESYGNANAFCTFERECQTPSRQAKPAGGAKTNP